MPLLKFWKHAREPLIYSVGTNSSLATLPVTLRALDRMARCIGVHRRLPDPRGGNRIR
jgi:Na+/H+-dicarboxylate symporter